MALLKASKRERKAAELEAKLLSKLRHPNIVSYKDSFEGNDGFLYIVMGLVWYVVQIFVDKSFIRIINESMKKRTIKVSLS